jgi:hypothetical protein
MMVEEKEIEEKEIEEKELKDSDLRLKKYPIEVLEKYVDNLSIKSLLHWQYLDARFCKKYILNEEYQTAEDYYLVTIEYVLKKQPHLKYDDLIYDNV